MNCKGRVGWACRPARAKSAARGSGQGALAGSTRVRHKFALLRRHQTNTDDRTCNQRWLNVCCTHLDVDLRDAKALEPSRVHGDVGLCAGPVGKQIHAARLLRVCVLGPHLRLQGGADDGAGRVCVCCGRQGVGAHIYPPPLPWPPPAPSYCRISCVRVRTPSIPAPAPAQSTEPAPSCLQEGTHVGQRSSSRLGGRRYAISRHGAGADARCRGPQQPRNRHAAGDQPSLQQTHACLPPSHLPMGPGRGSPPEAAPAPWLSQPCLLGVLRLHT